MANFSSGVARYGRTLSRCSCLFQRQSVALPSVTQSRNLNLQEYQSKELMSKYGCTVQRFRVADSHKTIVKLAKELGADEYVLKAQILAGGRGKGHFEPSGFKGGVKLTKNPEELSPWVEQMIGNRLITKQTPEKGVLVSKVMVAEAFDISRETYFAILMDRAHNGPVMVGSPEGGMDIEEVAEKTPELIFKIPIDIQIGITDEQAMEMASNLKFEGSLQREAAEEIKRMYELFLGVDATQVEINPFGETPDGKVVCFDAKINFDDNAEYRQKELFKLEDTSESDPREVQAASHNLNFIAMDGNIGCLVNGAGLAMATMDIIKLHGGEPANFLDLGGGVQENQVYEAFKLLNADKSVKAIFVNIFGGIVNCATVANGITAACRGMDLKIPVVVRLAGMNVDEASRILAESGLPIQTSDNLDDAAKKAVSCLQ
ncbi:succinate--CoA ligase [GDP-forming] subunit beta, mitochondrial-like [Antedon mediterranea]|uniref:succinate--CoA ligase [GDP-forming] subunit beta, mitochondrial-like n=1 Tax=Antedon mediterranea TaxID=105859 RepID=UPI003AF98ABB